MHELGIIRSVTRYLLDREKEFAPAKLRSVTLLVGENRLFVQDWVQMMFGVLTEGTTLEGARIELETVPATAQCNSCGEVFHYPPDHHHEPQCPVCGSDDLKPLTG
ncbi:MAG: hydrogenase maturation nickel metallochaperone HypA, partial [Clostridiales bacterium]|nr:hydrogenase maturation nickel metallochaperone HypA [Clostridiales bacterium]